MDLGVRGKSYILVGGSRGMAFEAGRVLAADGANLTLVSRTKDQVEAAAESIAKEFGVKAIGLVGDASVGGSMEGVVEQSIKAFGPPRGLLATSGLTGQNGDIFKTSDEDWEVNFQQVLMTMVRSCRAVLPSMLENGGGQIVTTAAYSIRATKSYLLPYSTMKTAISNFSKNLAKTYGGQGVRVNCVCPGAFATGKVQDVIDDLIREKGFTQEQAAEYMVKEAYKMPVAMGRTGKASEAGDLMAFLLSERAGYLTGAIINIDGGTDF